MPEVVQALIGDFKMEKPEGDRSNWAAPLRSGENWWNADEGKQSSGEVRAVLGCDDDRVLDESVSPNVGLGER